MEAIGKLPKTSIQITIEGERNSKKTSQQQQLEQIYKSEQQNILYKPPLKQKFNRKANKNNNNVLKERETQLGNDAEALCVLGCCGPWLEIAVKMCLLTDKGHHESVQC